MQDHDQSVEIIRNPSWPYIPDHPYSWFRTRKSLRVIIELQRLDIGNTYLFVKDSLESKYGLLITGRKKVGIKNLKNPKSFIDYSQTVDNI